MHNVYLKVSPSLPDVTVVDGTGTEVDVEEALRNGEEVKEEVEEDARMERCCEEVEEDARMERCCEEVEEDARMERCCDEVTA